MLARGGLLSRPHFVHGTGDRWFGPARPSLPLLPLVGAGVQGRGVRLSAGDV